jgi:hypothetical protein
MDRLVHVLAGLLGRMAGLLGEGRRDWVHALLAETGEMSGWPARLAWLGGGLWLVAREAVMRKTVQVLAFLAGAVALTRIGWPGLSSNSAIPVNRMYVIGGLLLLGIIPVLVRRYFGPARPGWVPRAAQVAGYAGVLVLIAAKDSKDRLGSKLGAYFAVVPSIWGLELLMLLVIAGYVAGLLILTTQRLHLSRFTLPAAAGIGTATAAGLYASAPFGVDTESVTMGLFVIPTVAVPLVAGFIVARACARDTRPVNVSPAQQGVLAATCAMATAAMLVAVLTTATIALLPHRVPLQDPSLNQSYISGGGCETCDPVSLTIPPAFRHEYYVELSIGQAGNSAFAALLVVPLAGAAFGAVGAGAAVARRPLGRLAIPGTTTDS